MDWRLLAPTGLVVAILSLCLVASDTSSEKGPSKKKHPFFRLLPHPPTMAQQLLAVRSRHNLWSAIAFIGPLREGVGILKQ